MFDTDIDGLNSEDLRALEDVEPVHNEADEGAFADFTFPSPLYRLVLDYSRESLYASASDELKLEAGDSVIVPTRYGKDMARVLGIAKKPIGVRPQDIVEIEKKASAEDLQRAAELKKKEKESLRIFKEKTAAHKLDMKPVGVHYLSEEQKVLFFFSSESRVDFRELVKDLVSVFKIRIELRQIGVRDESRHTGGLGVCGRPYCCHAVSDKLRPVSIRMAKEQNLSLNSMKISGQCGRLLCCLAYEYDWYAEARKKMPSEGLRIFYDNTNFRIAESNPITGMIKMSGEDGRVLEIASSRFKQIDGRWKLVD
ncbi:regulatory iron-sulfur-containing complex subunit RicT [Treponema sp. HNW]|uniref:PSP1 domain-containing protein n=1 Tax=Treponema sp. HNW TaxID=3116654 RepID=UPI003D140B2D